MKFENLDCRIDSPLERQLSSGEKRLKIFGSSTPFALAHILVHSISKQINILPHLVVTSSSEEAWRLHQSLAALDPQRQVYLLEPYDVSPYLGLQAKPQNIAEKIGFLFCAQNAKPRDIFIAPVSALIQRAIPYTFLRKNTFEFKVGDELPSDLNSFLSGLGYSSSSLVEDVGQYAIRGGILDIFSPVHELPIRIELFGDSIETIKSFGASDQRTKEILTKFTLLPCKEVLWPEHVDSVIDKFKNSVNDRLIDKFEVEESLRAMARKTYYPGFDFLFSYFFEKTDSVIDHFSNDLNIWLLDPGEITRQSDSFLEEMKSDFESGAKELIRPEIKDLFIKYEDLEFSTDSRVYELSAIEIIEGNNTNEGAIDFYTNKVLDLSKSTQDQVVGSDLWIANLQQKLKVWRDDNYTIFIGLKNKTQTERLRLVLEKANFKVEVTPADERLWNSWSLQQERDPALIHIVPHHFSESLRVVEDKTIYIRDEDLLGKKFRAQKTTTASEDFQKAAKRLNFADLKPGDCVVHTQHGIGIYEGLKIMLINGAESEFIQLSYKDKDKLYLPVYRIAQLSKYAGNAQVTMLDKLGGASWQKTTAKVKSHVRDIASDLLKIYAKRAEAGREPLIIESHDFQNFEMGFPFEETEDQERAINDIVSDFKSDKPMDRLICGDVGFGKTEVAMRAAFLAVQNKRQVAVLAPTTVLTFQHFETFKKRFANWPIEIRVMNRFVSTGEIKKTMADLKEGKVDIIIGTHKLLGKDLEYKDLGFLIIDEEQKFGVTHKEKIKKIKHSVDNLTLSATPIPRTLNMSLFGIKDLSLITTPPIDRLPTRTFICKWDETTIRKAVESEIKRGGQIYFIHNRVQSIYGIADELKKILPDVRMKVAHGQQEEHELEKSMLAFFNHEIDVLICTTIVESGMDIPRANTMFIDQAHMMGLSQLYQLRGRVGRSKLRAYCYLMVPNEKKLEKDAQERLKVLQENTALGSGVKIAQYDLELRGAGNILGEAQSGHINAVGYEMYMDLLNEAIADLKGIKSEGADVEPEINLRVAALIPDSYIGDIRLRLSYYKGMTEISSAEDLDRIEDELRDQFGEIPDQVTNLLGLMLVRLLCKKLGVKDLSAGTKNISLMFADRTSFKPETAIQLAMRENKKYSLTPDNRLNIRMNNIAWPNVCDELEYLLKL